MTKKDFDNIYFHMHMITHALVEMEDTFKKVNVLTQKVLLALENMRELVDKKRR